MRRRDVIKFGVRSSEYGVLIPHSAFRIPHSKGFTLIELVITIVLLGIISGVAAMIIMQGVKSYSDEVTRTDVHYQAKFAMERMAREIRFMRARSITYIPAMGDSQLEFYDINGTRIGFRLSGGNIERQESLGAWQRLASSVTDTAGSASGKIFTYYDTGNNPATVDTLWLVRIDFRATQGAESLDMRTTVHPRNF